MNYEIKSGDCLWNIVKTNYNLQNNQEISDMVNQIAEENSIEDINVINTGSNLVLPHNDKALFEKEEKTSVGGTTDENCADSFEKETNDNDLNIDKLAEFEKWTSSAENYEKALNGENVEDFALFDFNASTYSKDMKDFSQNWINKYDADKDGNWNYAEFVNMASEGEHNAELLSVADELYTLNKTAYEENVINKFDKDSDKSLNFREFLESQDFFTLKGFGIKKFFELKDLFNGLNIQKEDGNNNQVLNADELLLATTPEINGIDTATLKLQSDMNKEYQKQFETFNFDGNKESISAGEAATILYSSDLDLNNYAKTGDIASSIDGKVNYSNYQTYPMLDTESNGYKTIYQERMDFYNNFYKDKE